MRKLLAGAAALILAATLVTPTTADAALDEVNTKKLRNAVTVNNILKHTREFQKIANANGGTRASGTPGHTASANYVARTLRKAGYKVKLQEFTFPFFRDLEPAALSQLTPTATDFETQSFTYSGSGDVSGQIKATNDIVIPPAAEPSSTSGCEAADFAPAPTEPAIALIQRGTCTFEVKVDNAVAAGYDAVIIFNEGQDGRQELLTGTLGAPKSVPVVGLSFADGAALYAAIQAGPVTGRAFTSVEVDPERKTVNVIADSPAGKKKEIVVVGAHLDSVVEGPGINDNGSGSATILEIAKQMSALGLNDKLQRQVRFAFWGAEENGLLGSEHYVDSLTSRQLARHYANLNFDMVGSPNYVRFVYDGDGSLDPDDPDLAGPPGSAQIEKLFNSYFAGQGLATEPTAFDGRSDYGPFIAVGIPAGGLFTGAEEIKTRKQAKIFGGTAGVAYDRCYHQACDTMNNLNTKALNEMGDAAAHAVLTLARSKSGLFEDSSGVSNTKLRKATKAAPAASGHQAVR